MTFPLCSDHAALSSRWSSGHITKDMRFEPCRLSAQIAPYGRATSHILKRQV